MNLLHACCSRRADTAANALRKPRVLSPGCAVLAAVAVGVHPDIPTGAARMVQTERVVRPDMAAHANYAPFFEAYKALYGAAKPVIAQAAEGAAAAAVAAAANGTAAAPAGERGL